MTITIHWVELVRRFEIIVRIVNLPEGVGTLVHHIAPVGDKHLAGTLLHSALNHSLDKIVVGIGRADVASSIVGKHILQSLHSLLLVECA